MKKLVEHIINKNYKNATVFFKEEISTIVERKLCETKKKMMAKEDAINKLMPSGETVKVDLTGSRHDLGGGKSTFDKEASRSGSIMEPKTSTPKIYPQVKEQRLLPDGRRVMTNTGEIVLQTVMKQRRGLEEALPKTDAKKTTKQIKQVLTSLPPSTKTAVHSDVIDKTKDIVNKYDFAMKTQKKPPRMPFNEAVNKKKIYDVVEGPTKVMPGKNMGYYNPVAKWETVHKSGHKVYTVLDRHNNVYHQLVSPRGDVLHSYVTDEDNNQEGDRPADKYEVKYYNAHKNKVLNSDEFRSAQSMIEKGKHAEVRDAWKNLKPLDKPTIHEQDKYALARPTLTTISDETKKKINKEEEERWTITTKFPQG